MAETDEKLGSRHDNQKLTHKMVVDGGIDRVATRVDDPVGSDLLADIVSLLGGSPGAVATNHFNGTVGTTAVNIPASVGDPIMQVLIHNTSTGNKNLLVSFDNAVTFKTLTPDASLIWTLEKNTTQIDIKGSAAGTAYEIIMNRQP